MRIIIITDQYPPIDFGGMSQHAYYMTKYMSEKHDVMVILPEKFKGKKENIKYIKKSVLTLKHYKYDEYIITRIAKKFKPDVIHVCTAGMAYEKLSKQYPVVLRVVGNDFMRPWRGKSIKMRSILYRVPNSKLNNYLVRKELEIRKINNVKQMSKCSKIVANSEWTKDRLLEKGIIESKINIVVGGYDNHLFKPAKNKNQVREKIGINNESKVIITAANLVGKKGIDIVIKAVSVLRNIYNIQYYILGDGEELSNLKKLTKKLDLDELVHFEGRKSQKELCEYYQAADMYVQVSRNQYLQNGGIDVETMGRTYFEAGACGIPVIASRSGGIPSVVEHNKNGLLIDNAEDVNEVVQVIRKILDDKDMSNKISQAAEEISKEKYSWEKVVSEFEKIFEDVCAENI